MRFEYAAAQETRTLAALRDSYGLFIGGSFAGGSSVFKTISPATEEVLAEVTHGIHAIETVHFQKSGIEDHVLLSWLLEPMAPSVVTWFDECLAKPSDGLRARLTAQGFLD